MAVATPITWWEFWNGLLHEEKDTFANNLPFGSSYTNSQDGKRLCCHLFFNPYWLKDLLEWPAHQDLKFATRYDTGEWIGETDLRDQAQVYATPLIHPTGGASWAVHSPDESALQPGEPKPLRTVLFAEVPDVPP